MVNNTQLSFDTITCIAEFITDAPTLVRLSSLSKECMKLRKIKFEAKLFLTCIQMKNIKKVFNEKNFKYFIKKCENKNKNTIYNSYFSNDLISGNFTEESLYQNARDFHNVEELTISKYEGEKFDSFIRNISGFTGLKTLKIKKKSNRIKEIFESIAGKKLNQLKSIELNSEISFSDLTILPSTIEKIKCPRIEVKTRCIPVIQNEKVVKVTYKNNPIVFNFKSIETDTSFLYRTFNCEGKYFFQCMLHCFPKINFYQLHSFTFLDDKNNIICDKALKEKEIGLFTHINDEILEIFEDELFFDFYNVKILALRCNLSLVKIDTIQTAIDNGKLSNIESLSIISPTLSNKLSLDLTKLSKLRSLFSDNDNVQFTGKSFSLKEVSLYSDISCIQDLFVPNLETLSLKIVDKPTSLSAIEKMKLKKLKIEKLTKYFSFYPEIKFNESNLNNQHTSIVFEEITTKSLKLVMDTNIDMINNVSLDVSKVNDLTSLTITYLITSYKNIEDIIILLKTLSSKTLKKISVKINFWYETFAFSIFTEFKKKLKIKDSLIYKKNIPSISVLEINFVSLDTSISLL